MNVLPVLITVWGFVVAAFVALMVYRGHLTRQETDQLFLSDSNMPSVHEEQDEIVRRVNLIHPLCQGLGVAALLITLAIVGTYIFQSLPNLHF